MLFMIPFFAIELLARLLKKQMHVLYGDAWYIYMWKYLKTTLLMNL